MHHIARGSHQHIVGVHTRIPLMEVSRTDAGYIISCFHADMGNLGMYFQTFHSENYMDARILHLLRPTDVGSFVKARQEFDNHRYLFPVAGGTDKGFHHLRIFSKTIERCLDAFHFFADRRFLQHSDIIIKAVIRYMDKAVAFLYQLQQTLVAVQFRFYDRLPCGIFQILAAAIRKRHQILVVVITSATQHRIQLVQIQLVHYTLQQVFRHVGIVNHPQGITFLAAFHSFGYFLQHAVAQVIVYLHFRILCKLERIRLEKDIVQPGEYHRQAVADYIVQIHQIAPAFLIRQTHKTPALGYGKRNQCIIKTFPTFGLHLDSQIDVLIRFIRQLPDCRKPYRTDKTAQLLAVELTHEQLLSFIQLVLFQQEDVFLTQQPGYLVDGVLIFFGILVIQFVDLLDKLAGMLALRTQAFILTLGNATERSHADTEKLIQIIGINTEKAQSLQ